MLVIRLITNERILMPIIFFIIFYGYNTKVYDLLNSSVEVDFTMFIIHIICISILSYLLTLGMLLLILIFLHNRLKSIEKSFDFTSYTFFNQLEALTIAIDTFVDTVNTVEEFNSKFTKILSDNFIQWQ